MSEGKEIPKHWEVKKLGEVCLKKEGLRRGPFGSAIKKEFFVPDGYKVYEQSNAIYDDINRGRYFIDENKFKELIAFNIKAGDLIVSCSGTLGRIAQIPINAKPGVINQALLRIRLIDEIVNKKYFLYYFRSALFQRKIFDQSQGTAMSNLIGIKDFKEIKITIPPLPEQQAIVSKIEELLSDLENGKQQLQTAQQQLKVYRQSLLKAAFQGKLTTNWRSLNEKISEAFEVNDILKERQQVFQLKLAEAKANKTPKPRTPKNLDNKFKINQEYLRFVSNIPKEWKVIHLAAISNSSPDSIVDGPFGSSINVENDYVGDGVPVIRINNILPFCFDKNKLKFIRTDKFQQLKRHNIVPGDVLFGKVGTIGNSCIYPVAEPEAMLATTGSCRIRVDPRIVTNKFLCYYLNSQRRNFNEIASAAVQAFLNMGTINNFPIPICPLEEQQIIVSELESKLTVCDKIEETISQSLQKIETLRQSILKKAFEGKLVKSEGFSVNKKE